MGLGLGLGLGLGFGFGLRLGLAQLPAAPVARAVEPLECVLQRPPPEVGLVATLAAMGLELDDRRLPTREHPGHALEHERVEAWYIGLQAVLHRVAATITSGCSFWSRFGFGFGFGSGLGSG